jgi:hypothetical protein
MSRESSNREKKTERRKERKENEREQRNKKTGMWNLAGVAKTEGHSIANSTKLTPKRIFSL